MSSTFSAGVAIYQVGKNLQLVNRDIAVVSAVSAAGMQRGPSAVQSCVGLSEACAACDTTPSPALTGAFTLGTLEASGQTDHKSKIVLPRS